MDTFTPGSPVYALLNVRSGWDDGSVCQDLLSKEMSIAGVRLDIEQAKAGLDITAAVRRAREQGATVVIAGGGDGTLNGVAAGLNGSKVPMAILPIGTLNHLARDLGVSLDIGEAISQLRNDTVAQIDLGSVNGRVFLNNSVIGLYPAYWFAREKIEHRWKVRWVSIASAIISVFRKNPYLDLKLTVNGREIRRQTPYVLIANNEHRMEGYRLGSRDRLDRGLLFVYVMRKLSRWGLLRMAASLLLGRFRKQHDFETFAVDSMAVETKRKKLAVSLDGEVKRLRTPLQYKSLPAALHVVVPPATLEKAPGV